jgi:hypothetical protein
MKYPSVSEPKCTDPFQCFCCPSKVTLNSENCTQSLDHISHQHTQTVYVYVYIFHKTWIYRNVFTVWINEYEIRVSLSLRL